MTLALAVALTILTQAPATAPGPPHAENAVYRAVLAGGLDAGGVAVPVPGPSIVDGMAEADRRSALGGAVDLPVEEFLRDSVNAPIRLKVRDVAYPGGVVRVVDLWFAVHAGLDEIRDVDLEGPGGDPARGEVGNMSFEARALTVDELKARGKAVAVGGPDRYALTGGLLLDRIRVSTTNHVAASRSGESLVVASMTDHGFDDDAGLASRWAALPRPGAPKVDPGPPRPYPGSAGYARVGRFSANPAVLVVEAHSAFAEPKEWFDGAPILRSKLGLVAQDQVRRLRREVARRRKGSDRP